MAKIPEADKVILPKLQRPKYTHTHTHTNFNK